MEADVVIVGSGIAGLTAGAILVKNGKKVVIVEKQPNFGGALRQFKRKKISFDVGFHYTGCLGEGDVLDLIWKYCEVLPEISVLPFGHKGYDRFEIRGVEEPVRGYFCYKQLAAELKSHFPSDHTGIDTYFAAVQQICSEVPFYNTSLPLTPFLRGYKTNPSSLAEFLNSITGNRQLQAILAAPAFLYGVPIQQASLQIHALVAHGYYSGAYSIDGGGQAIVDAFVSSLQRKGVEFIGDAAVTSIEQDNGAVTAVEIDDMEKIFCDQVIYTGHPAYIPGLVARSAFRPAYRSRLLELKNSLSMFAVFGKSDRLLDTRQGPVNYYLLPGESDVLPEWSETPHNLRPMMMTSPRNELKESLHQNRNGIILLRLGYWRDIEKFTGSSSSGRSEEYENFKRDIAAEMIDTAEQQWGDLCGNIESLAVGTPLTFKDELTAPEGCAYGAMHCLGQFNPDVRTRVSGLYLGGQSTLMTGVVGSSISGLVSAGEILGLEPLWEEVRKCN